MLNFRKNYLKPPPSLMTPPFFPCLFFVSVARIASVPCVASSPRCGAAACRAWKTAGLQTFFQVSLKFVSQVMFELQLRYLCV